MAQAVSLSNATSTLGAPSLRFCKGGYGDAGTGEARPPESPDGDRVQVIRAVTATRPLGSDKSPRIGSLVPALAKDARMGTPGW